MARGPALSGTRRPPTPPARPAGRPRPITAGRLARRIAFFVVAVVAIWWAERGAFQGWSDRIFGPRVDWTNDYAMTMRVYDLVVRDRLTTLPRSCLLLNIHGGDPPTAQNLDLFERPTVACTGSRTVPEHALPLLFHVRVDRLDGTVAIDQGTPGLFHPIPR